MRKMYLIKVQSIRFDPNWIKPGTFYKNEKRRVISKHELISCKSYKNGIPMLFSINNNNNNNNKE